MLWYIAWRNIWRNPIRSVLTISALAGSLIMVMLYASLMEGMSRQMIRNATEISSGHLQVQRQGYIDEQDLYATIPGAYLEQVEAQYSSVNFAPRLYASALASTSDYSNGVLIQAIDPERERAVTRMLDHIRQGQADFDPLYDPLTQTDRYGIIAGAQLAKNLQLAIGDELVLMTQAIDGSIGNALFYIAAVLKPLEPNFDRSGVLMSIQAYQQLMYLEDGYHELVIKLDHPENMLEMQQALTQAVNSISKQQPLDEFGGDPVVRNWRQLNQSVSDMLNLSQSMVWVIGMVIIALASLGMLNTMMMAIHERTHEFGILLAIGMKRRWLLLMVMFEAVFLSMISAIAGSILGWFIIRVVLKNGIDFSGSLPDGFDWAGMVFEPVMLLNLQYQHVLIGCLIMLGVTLIASLIPSWRTIRLNPAQVL